MVITDAALEKRCHSAFFVGGEELDPGERAVAVAVEAGPHPAERISDTGGFAGLQHQAERSQNEFWVCGSLCKDVVRQMAHPELVIVRAAEEELTEFCVGWCPVEFVGVPFVPS
jgi:hypothetical protein